MFFVLILSGCTAPEQKKNSSAYDTLVKLVKYKLKTHADTALFLSSNLYQTALENKDEFMVYEAALLRGKAFQAVKMNDSALRYFQQMRQMAFRMNDTLKILETCNVIGTLFADMGNNDSVRYWYDKGLFLAKISGDSIYLAGFSANMGLFYSQNGQADSAMICFSEAAHYYEKRSDSGNMAQIYRNIGNLFLNEGLYQKANQYYRRSIAINLSTENILETGNDYTNLAISYMMMDSDSALFYYREAMSIFTDFGTATNLLQVKFNFANYLKNKGRYHEAENTYKEVLRISRTNKILQGEMYSLNQLGRIEAIRKNSISANEYFNEAISIAALNKQTADLTQFYHEAFEGNMELQNVNVALNYFRKWEQLNDSLKASHQRETILKYQTIYESKILQSRVQDLHNELKIRKSQNIITGLIVVVLLLSLATIVIVNIYRHKQTRHRQLQAERENQLRQFELEKITLEKEVQDEKLVQMNLQIQLKEQDLVYQTLLRTDLSNLNRSIQEKLRPYHLLFTRKKDQQEFLQTLQMIAHDAAHDPLADFEIMFRQMHGNFFEKLMLKCPDLSKSELQVASMIRLNLSTKEIARLINLSPATIETTRHHIRKKLELDQKESLTACLISI